MSFSSNKPDDRKQTDNQSIPQTTDMNVKLYKYKQYKLKQYVGIMPINKQKSSPFYIQLISYLFLR